MYFLLLNPDPESCRCGFRFTFQTIKPAPYLINFPQSSNQVGVSFVALKTCKPAPRPFDDKIGHLCLR